MSIVGKSAIAQCAFGLALRLPLRQSYNILRHSIHHVRFSTRADSLAQIHLPLHVQAYRNDLRLRTATWEGYTDPIYTKYGTMTMSATSNTSSGKRKRSSPKFYAVRVGRKPGIYQSWPDCEVQVKGVHSVYKSFPTLTEAEAFMKGTSSPATIPSSASKANKFYGVAVGHVPGVYTDYASVHAQTKNCPGAKQESFATREEAQAFVNGFRRDASAPISLRGDLSEGSSLTASKGSKAGDNPAKRVKKNDAGTSALTNGDIALDPAARPLPEDAVDGFDPRIKLDVDTGNIRVKTDQELSGTKLQPTGDITGAIHVYTDGSSLGNGRVGAVGGVGVYFGPNDTRNVSEALRGKRQTNQRAELTAVARALDHVPIDRAVLIHTDSNYSIKCLTEWFQKWEKQNWKSSSGKDVENKDLIEPIIARIRERNMCHAKTDFKWIKGHGNDPGNIAADLLAVQGSRNSTPELRAADIKAISPTLNTLNAPTRIEQWINTKRDLGHANAIDAESAFLNEDDEAADYDKIFADLAAERSAQTDGAGFPTDEYAPPSGTELGDGQGINGDPPKVDGADSMDFVQ